MKNPAALVVPALVVSAALIAPGAAFADSTYCVGSDAALADAITVATLARADADIRLRRRAAPYVITSMPSTAGYNMFAGLRLRGGFGSDANCDPANREIDASNTRLNFEPVQTGPLRLGTDGNLTIEGLTLTSPRGVNLKGFGSGVIAVVSSQLENSSAVGQHVLQIEGGALAPIEMRISNTLVEGNTVFGDHGVIGLYGNAISSAVLINNTIGNNSGGVEFINLEGAEFFNNIIWENASFGLKDMSQVATKTPVTLIDNILQSGNTLPLINESSGSIDADPNFVDAASGNYRLDGLTSIGVDSGTLDVPGGLTLLDIEGSPRVVGGLVDRGAYETGIDDAQNIVVNTTLDSSNPGPGLMSLRRALEIAQQNTATPTRISFAVGDELIPACPAVFHLDMLLPDISTQVEIDGFTQGGASPNSQENAFDALICVELEGDGTFHALRTTGADSSLRVKGVRFSDFSSAVILQNGSFHEIVGNAFGSIVAGNLRGVVSEPSAKAVHVGGYDAASRNHFIGSSIAAITMKSHGGYVQGNLIGPSGNGFSQPPLPNAMGIVIIGSGNEVSKNIVSGNESDGILNQGEGTAVFSNNIGAVVDPLCGGAEATCYSPLPNARGLVTSQFFGVQNTGSKMLAYGNRIAFNAGPGVAVLDGTSNNRIYSNRIHDNNGQGVDLGDDGVAEPLNVDASESPSSANKGQNFPEVDSAEIAEDHSMGTVSGTLSSSKGNYFIQLFATSSCDGTGQGEGEEPIGAAVITLDDPASQDINASGSFTIEVQSSGDLVGKFVTAQANDSLGNSSEFSFCEPFTGVALPDPIFADGFE